MARGKTWPDKTKEKAKAMVAAGNRQSYVAKKLGIPVSTLATWLTNDERKSFEREFEEKKKDADEKRKMEEIQLETLRARRKAEFINLAWEEIFESIRSMGKKRDEASYMDLAKALGILYDKVSLAIGEPTSREEHSGEVKHTNEYKYDITLRQLIDNRQAGRSLAEILKANVQRRGTGASS